MTDARVVDRDRAATRWALYTTVTVLALIALLYVIVGLWFSGNAGSAAAGQGGTFVAWIDRIALVAVPLLAVVLGALLTVLVFRTSSAEPSVDADVASHAVPSLPTDDDFATEAGSMLLARDLMEHVVDVEGVVLEDDAELNSIPLSPLIDLLDEGQASRIPVFDSQGRLLFVLPGITVYEFAFNAAVDAAVDAGGEPTGAADEPGSSDVFSSSGQH